MPPTVDDDGCPAFEAVVNFDDSAIGAVLRCGVALDGPLGEGLWGIASEVDDVASKARERSFTLETGSARRDLLPDALLSLWRAAATKIGHSLLPLDAECEIDRSRLRRPGAWLYRR
jgi:hypothetical protein